MQKLLIIDDDEELCGELSQILKAEGFDVDTALDGLAGKECIKQRRYHLVILDLKLPGINGYQVLKSMHGQGRRPKVMVLSGRPLGGPLQPQNSEEDKILTMADAVMNKPFVIESFIDRIKHLVSD